MVKCSNCSKNIDSDSKYCTHCGLALKDDKGYKWKRWCKKAYSVAIAILFSLTLVTYEQTGDKMFLIALISGTIFWSIFIWLLYIIIKKVKYRGMKVAKAIIVLLIISIPASLFQTPALFHQISIKNSFNPYQPYETTIFINDYYSFEYPTTFERSTIDVDLKQEIGVDIEGFDKTKHNAFVSKDRRFLAFAQYAIVGDSTLEDFERDVEKVRGILKGKINQNIIEKSYMEINGYNFYKEISEASKDGKELMLVQFVTIKNGILYSIGGSSKPQDFMELKVIIENLIPSFKILYNGPLVCPNDLINFENRCCPEGTTKIIKGECFGCFDPKLPMSIGGYCCPKGSTRVDKEKGKCY